MEFKSLMVVVFILLQLDPSFGEGIIDIHFLSYEDDCDEFLGAGDCDPMFTFCVTRPDLPNTFSRADCWYKTTPQSGHFSNKNYINFENMKNIEGLTNPWMIGFKLLSSDSIKLVWRVQEDEDWPVGSKHLVTDSIILKERVWPNEGMAEYAKRKAQKSDHVLRFQIRIYCTEDTYGPKCEVHCPAPSASDRYYCDLETGNKKCIDGWEGEDCNTNVDECAKGVCVHGECTDTTGSYTCKNCEDGYSGPNCDISDDACQENPCKGRGDCLQISSSPYFTCDCYYPYTGPQCNEESRTTTTTTSTPPTNTSTTTSTTSESSITTITPSSPSAGAGITGNAGDASTTTDQQDTDSTKGPTAQASKAGSAGFDGWIILVVGLCLIILIGSVIIFFVCRRKKIVQRRKESRAALSPVTYDGENLAFDNVAYTQMGFNNSSLERSQDLPKLPIAPPLTHTNPSFQPEMGVKNGHEDMDDDGYLKANAISTFTRDTTDGLTASGRRAQSNLYSNFDYLNGGDNGVANQDYDDEEHYHDLDEAAMSVRRNNNVDSIQPLSAEEESGYSEIPRNTPSYKNRKPDDYDQVHVRPVSRNLPQLPSAPEHSSERQSSNEDPSQPKDRKTFYPEMTNQPLRRSDPFASQVPDDEYTGPDIDLPTRDVSEEYDAPRKGQKGHGRFAGDGEGGYELPSSNGFDEGVSKRSNESGGYEVPDRPPTEYDNPSAQKKQNAFKTSTFHMTAGTMSIYNQEENTAREAGEKKESGMFEDDDISFPPPPPPLSPEDLDRIEEPAPRPLSFHYGLSEKKSDEKENRGKKKSIENDGFLNPMFGGDGPSNRSPSSGIKGSRPLSFHQGKTEKDEDDDFDETGDDDTNRIPRKRLENTGFENPIFDTDGQRIDDDPSDVDGANDVQNDGKSPKDDDVSIQTGKPGVLPLYMENFGFNDIMDL